MKHTKFDINPKGRDFFVGDIHGMYDEFMEQLRIVDFDFEYDRVFSVGDLIDRGPKNIECLDLLETTWFHAIKGNHEWMMLGQQPRHVWMNNGGEWWNDHDVDTQDCYKHLVVNMHDKITVDTVYGRIGVCHADVWGHWPDWMETDNPVDITGEPAAIWGRSRIYSMASEEVTGVDAVVVGHTPVQKVTTLWNVIYIDTGACGGGFITLIEAEKVMEQVAYHIY